MKDLKYQMLSSPFRHITVLRGGTKQNKIVARLNHSINPPCKLPVSKSEQSIARTASVHIQGLGGRL